MEDPSKADIGVLAQKKKIFERCGTCKENFTLETYVKTEFDNHTKKIISKSTKIIKCYNCGISLPSE